MCIRDRLYICKSCIITALINFQNENRQDTLNHKFGSLRLTTDERFSSRVLICRTLVYDSRNLWSINIFLEIFLVPNLSLIHISEPTRLGMISYAVFCLKKKKDSRIPS
eukprot:TRINITY_DN8900_c0_g1_i2.p1 TRINITY_DN8900_c0_g1~~TRINITY_DN8900_c0_g1_i2.p1  ORF type:complete len:109 (+),score=9.46 TRINITY_DN8900_c0_g1_i2:80-406(+)